MGGEGQRGEEYNGGHSHTQEMMGWAVFLIFEVLVQREV